VHMLPFTDQGVHEYEIAILASERWRPKAGEEEVARQQRPIRFAETTRGMTDRFDGYDVHVYRLTLNPNAAE